MARAVKFLTSPASRSLLLPRQQQYHFNGICFLFGQCPTKLEVSVHSILSTVGCQGLTWLVEP